MDWVKQNWRVLATIAIALAILGGACWFFYSSYREAQQVMNLLAQQSQELERLSRLNPHPGNERVDNIAAAREQEEQIRKLIEEAKAQFVPIEYPTNLSSPEFKLYLDKTLAELRRLAEQAGVRIGEDFAFGFENIRNQMSFEAKDIPMLSRQVAEIATVARLLCKAKVLTIDRVRRSPVVGQTNEAAASTAPGYGVYTPAVPPPAPSPTPLGVTDTNLWDRKPITNDLAILTPYEFTFHCFTSELERFLSELAQSKYGLLLKGLAVDPTPSVLLQQPGMMGLGVGAVGAHAGPGPMDRTLASRYGIDMAGIPGMMGMPGFGPRRVGNQIVVLDERPFRVRIWIYAVKLLTPEEAAAIKAQQAMSPAPPTPAGYGYPAGMPYQGPSGWVYPQQGVGGQTGPQTPPGLIEHR